MTVDEKAAAAKARADVKAKADSLKPVVVVQFQGSDIDLSDLVEAAKADFRKEKKRTCQRRDGFVVFRRTENVEKWRVKVYSLCIIILAVFARQA